MEPPKNNTTYFQSKYDHKKTPTVKCRQRPIITRSISEHSAQLDDQTWTHFGIEIFKFNNTLPPHFLCLPLHENCGDSLSNTIAMVQKLSWEETADIHLTNDIIRHCCLCSVKIMQALNQWKNAMWSHHPANNKYLKWIECYTPVSQSWIIWTITKHTRQC